MNRDTARAKYDHRTEQTRTIKQIGAALYETDQWTTGAGAAELLADGVQPGDVIVFETVLATQITGARRVGEEQWIFRRTTDELIAEHEAFVNRIRERERAQLEEHRADWTAREAALPGWLRDRLTHFHDRGGEGFELAGWGYELTVCEIAVILLEHDLDAEAPAVMAYAREQGTTGNQHGMALALARAHREDPDATMSGTVSALSPITGDADYSGKADS